jgi:hypothetical protein
MNKNADSIQAMLIDGTGRRFWDRYFYFFMSLLIVVVVAFGFSQTIDMNLIHPTIPRPFLLYVHAALFTGWLAFFILQSALVRTSNVRIHRAIGTFGIAMGVGIPVLGVATALTMTRFDIEQLHNPTAATDMIIPLFDMVAFTSTFILAIFWRKKPELHRRLILVATCALTAAGFGRFPAWILPPSIFYAGVDLLILLGVARDLIVNRKVHAVYVYVLPAFIVGQTVALYAALHRPALWVSIAHMILS